MTKPKVWFTSIEQDEPPAAVAKKVLALSDKAGLADLVQENGLVGILQHVGEGKGVGFIKPEITHGLAARVSALNGRPFLTGSSTLYRGNRSNAVNHLMQAYDHGFTPDRIGCPIVMVDGLRGSDAISVDVPEAKHCKIVHLGSGVGLMEGLIVVTHPTGHPETGFGAAIKNVGMGLASRGGKLAMHHGSYPKFVADKCTACGRCATWCPADAIEVKQVATLIKDRCVGCGECLAVCGFNAINFDWSVGGAGLQERLVEHCAGVRSRLGENVLYVNVIQHYQKGCDCFGTTQDAVCPDVGVVVSRDLVAVDTATADLLIRATGKDIARDVGGREYRDMLAYGESMGLGSTEYELVEE